jgi:hypothetical protein
VELSNRAPDGAKEISERSKRQLGSYLAQDGFNADGVSFVTARLLVFIGDPNRLVAKATVLSVESCA